LTLIGLDFENTPKILGWFLIVITVVLFINFVLMLGLDIVKYFKRNIINNKAQKLTSDTAGMTYDDIDKEYKRQEQYQEEYREVRGHWSLGDEAEEIRRKVKALQESFDIKHLRFYNIVELLFNGVLPTILAIFGFIYLYCFLIQ
jgi:hypothetical protein